MGKQTRTRSRTHIYDELSEDDSASENEHDISVIECAQRPKFFKMAPSKLNANAAAKKRDWDNSLLNSTIATTCPTTTNTTTNTLATEMTSSVEESVDKWRQLRSETLLTTPNDTNITENMDAYGEELLDMLHTKLTIQVSTSSAALTEQLQTSSNFSPTDKVSTPPQNTETFCASVGPPQDHETPNITRHRLSPLYSTSNTNNDEYIKLLATVITGQQEMLKNMLTQNLQQQQQQHHNAQEKQQELQKLIHEQHQKQIQQTHEFENQLQKQQLFFREQMISQKQQMQEHQQRLEERLQKQQEQHQQNLQQMSQKPLKQQQPQQQMQTSNTAETPAAETTSPTTEANITSQATTTELASTQIPAPASSNQPDRAPSQKKNQRKHAVIYGDSIVNHVNTFEMAKGYRNTITRVCCYKGAETGEIAEHTQVDMKKRRVPHTAILHGGSNDLQHKVQIPNIINEASLAATMMQTKGVKNIAISSVTPRFGLKDKITRLNNELKKLCQEMNITYIDNSNIKYNLHISDWDYTHLNHEGVKKLQENFASYIKSVEMKE